MQTSLELAIECDISMDVIKLLVNSGAKVVPADDEAYDSALIVACKNSSEALPYLIEMVSDESLLDVVNSEGILKWSQFNSFKK